MNTIEYGIVTDWGEIGGESPSVRISIGDSIQDLTEGSIEFVKKELPELLRNGESLHIMTHLDNDDYFIIEVIRDDWPKNKYCDVRVLSYCGGGLDGGYSRFVDLRDKREIKEFISDIF